MRSTRKVELRNWFRFRTLHLLFLLTISAVCTWWVTVAGIQRVNVRLETFEVHIAYNNPTEAEFLFRIIHPLPDTTPESAEFLSVNALINSIPDTKDRAKLVGREFEFKFQKRDAFWRKAETIGTAAVKAIYSDLFQVNEEQIEILPVESANPNY